MKAYNVGWLEGEVERDTVDSADLPDFGGLPHVQAEGRYDLRESICT